MQEPASTEVHHREMPRNSEGHTAAAHTVHTSFPKPDQSHFPRTITGRSILGLSLCQMLLAVLAITFESASLALSSTINSDKMSATFSEIVAWAAHKWPTMPAIQGSEYGNYVYYFDEPGSGIWAGCFVIIAASFGIAAGRSRKSKCLIVTHMILSIMASAITIGIIVSTSISIGEVKRCNREANDYYAYFAFACDDDRWSIVGGLQVAVLICGIALGGLCIASSAYCCKATCCCRQGHVGCCRRCCRSCCKSSGYQPINAAAYGQGYGSIHGTPVQHVPSGYPAGHPATYHPAGASGVQQGYPQTGFHSVPGYAIHGQVGQQQPPAGPLGEPRWTQQGQQPWMGPRAEASVPPALDGKPPEYQG